MMLRYWPTAEGTRHLPSGCGACMHVLTMHACAEHACGADEHRLQVVMKAPCSMSGPLHRRVSKGGNRSFMRLEAVCIEAQVGLQVAADLLLGHRLPKLLHRLLHHLERERQRLRGRCGRGRPLRGGLRFWSRRRLGGEQHADAVVPPRSHQATCACTCTCTCACAWACKCHSMASTGACRCMCMCMALHVLQHGFEGFMPMYVQGNECMCHSMAADGCMPMFVHVHGSACACGCTPMDACRCMRMAVSACARG